MGLRPINCLKDMFKKSKIDLGYYGFDPRIFRAICEALFENSSVENLDIKVNQFKLIFHKTENIKLELSICFNIYVLWLINKIIQN